MNRFLYQQKKNTKTKHLYSKQFLNAITGSPVRSKIMKKEKKLKKETIIAFRVDDETLSKLTELAASTDRSISWLIRDAVKKIIKK
jgi:hypothetical protein